MANLSARKCGKLFLFCRENIYLISQMKTAIEHTTPVQSTAKQYRLHRHNLIPTSRKFCIWWWLILYHRL